VKWIGTRIDTQFQQHVSPLLHYSSYHFTFKLNLINNLKKIYFFNGFSKNEGLTLEESPVYTLYNIIPVLIMYARKQMVGA